MFSISRIIKNSLFILFIFSPVWLSGCASISKGVTEAFLDNKDSADPDMGACVIDSPPVAGLQDLLYGSDAEPQQRGTLNVLMIHGIGETYPEYSVSFQRRLTEELGLTRIVKKQKIISMESRDGRSPLGELRVTRYLDDSGRFQLLFHELTWSEITRPYKNILDQDLNNREAQLRTGANQTLKSFVDDHLVDPTLYRGKEHDAILESASQGMCWMLHNDWQTLPDEVTGRCQRSNSEDILENFTRHPKQRFVIVTHSLGSQIVLDMLDRDLSDKKKWIPNADPGHEAESLRKVTALLSQQDFHIYMFANQLKLLQLGVKPPEQTGAVERFCGVGAPSANDRLLDKLHILAFSDPNDLLSYGVPDDFSRNYIDSRLCPEVINVYVNVAPVISLLGLGNITSPVEAHNNYESDPRVIGLITHGIGYDKTSEAVAEGCQWMETVRE